MINNLEWKEYLLRMKILLTYYFIDHLKLSALLFSSFYMVQLLYPSLLNGKNIRIILSI